MNSLSLIRNLQIFIGVYFVLLHAFYAILSLAAFWFMRKHYFEREARYFPPLYTEEVPPISFLVPAYNEEKIILSTLYSLLQIEYTHFEVILINDGSTDATLETLKNVLDLKKINLALPNTLRTKSIQGIYQSSKYESVWLIDKQQGGKSDALNAGILLSHYPLFCSMDADSVLSRKNINETVQPFLENPHTVVAGGLVNVANGCKVKDGFLAEYRLPKSILALFQLVEYLRAFLLGRVGFSTINALLIVSGAFGIFKKQAVLDVGGYNPKTVGEDMELVLRLHKHLLLNQIPYNITLVPQPVCWTEVPEDLKTLKNQRIRWQRGLAEALFFNIKLLFHPRSGVVGWVIFPFFLFFEFLGPCIELLGYVLFASSFALGWITPTAFFSFFVVAVSTGLLLSSLSLLLQELSFSHYTRSKNILILFCISILENLGFRQLISFFRFIGILQWLFGKKSPWGQMKRQGNWAS